jgi:L-threonine kinase
MLPDGTSFVVTCPIDRGTTVDVALSPAPVLEITGVPHGLSRLEDAVRRTIELLELAPCRVAVQHVGSLPVGKGMASSTADVIAASRAVARAAGEELAAEDLATLAAAIEPSDGVMYDGIVAADRETGRRLRAWDWWPSFTVVMLEPPEGFATAYARFDDQAAHAGEYARLLEQLDDAVAGRDELRFARAATRSAELGQAYVPNAVFSWLAPRAPELGALGVCAAHTGTVAGLLFPRTRAGEAAAAAAERSLRASAPSSYRVSVARTPSSPA